MSCSSIDKTLASSSSFLKQNRFGRKKVIHARSTVEDVRLGIVVKGRRDPELTKITDGSCSRTRVYCKICPTSLLSCVLWQHQLVAIRTRPRMRSRLFRRLHARVSSADSKRRRETRPRPVIRSFPLVIVCQGSVLDGEEASDVRLYGRQAVLFRDHGLKW